MDYKHIPIPRYGDWPAIPTRNFCLILDPGILLEGPPVPWQLFLKRMG